MKLFKNYFKNRKVSFYFGLFTALLSLASGLIYYFFVAKNEELASYFNLTCFILPVIAFAIFLIFALFRQTKIATIVMAALDFASALILIATIYPYLVSKVMEIANIFDIPYFFDIALAAIFLLVSAIISNILCYTNMEKKEEFKEDYHNYITRRLAK